MKTKINVIYLALAILVSACSQKKADPSKADDITTPGNQQVKLDAPYQTKAVRNYCKVIGWSAGTTPVAPAGFKVNQYAGGLDNPRNIYVARNGDVFISQANTEVKGLKKIGADIIGASKSEDLNKSANNIILLRDTNGDGTADIKFIFLSGLNQPFGMLILGSWFYVANTDGLWRYPYTAGQTKIAGKGTKILSLPAGGYNNHWTRNLRANKDSSKIYISVGSGTNDEEQGPANEIRRADVLEINPDGTHERIYANGLRNPAGIDFNPQTNELWASVNERDNLGDNLVPDYLTSVKEGGFYGWPYVYFGKHEDPNHKGEHPEMVVKSITPDLSLGPHTASLGLAFYTGKSFPQQYHGGAFIGQHGSWNRSVLSGYKVLFVPFTNGKINGTTQDFLTGFVADAAKEEVHGRPVSIAVAPDGAILVADDAGNKIWRVSAAK
jgi:glucose/arabinose dehydrogenase